MKPQDYIQEQLSKLSSFQQRIIPKEQLVDEIFRIVMSKKFRKYAANDGLVAKIKKAIEINVENNDPINITFPHGAYKLWRLKEAPVPDWAELFASMYYIKWLKPICEIYEPGVTFDYFVDDLIIPRMNGISMENVEQYIHEEQAILDFLKAYRPKNFSMVVTPFEKIWGSRETFNKELDECIEVLAKTNPTFSEADLVSVELNAKPTDEQLKDPDWKQKVRIIHDAYMPLKRSLGYYFQPEKIPAFCQPIPSGKFLIVGTTKTSIAKFWVGIGALKRNGESYKEYVLSPKQIEKVALTRESISIEGLSGKNFHSINIF